MRALGSFIVWLLALIIVVALVIFAVQNVAPVSAHFLGYAFSASLWLVIAACAVLGFILAALLMTPGRVASGWRARSLARSRAQTEAELADLQERHAQLQAERDRLAASESGLQAERDQLQIEHDRLLQAQRDQQTQAEREQQLQAEQEHQLQAQRERDVRTQPVAPATAQPMAPAPSDTAPGDATVADNRSDTRTDTAVPPQRTTVYAHEPDGAGATDTTSPDGMPDGAQPTLGERIRGMFRGPGANEDETAGTYDQPPAPTA